MSGLGFNPIPHEQNYSVSYMIGVFKDPKVLSSAYCAAHNSPCYGIVHR